MAQVPYRGYPEGGPENVPLRPEVPSGIFAGTQAITQAGKEIQGAGDEVWRAAVKLREMDIEAEVNKAVTDNLTKTGELDNAFRQLEGKDAQDNLQGHIAALKQTREGYRGGLSSRYAQQKYDQETMRRLGYDIINAGNYAAGQLKSYDKTARVGAQSAITDNLMSDPYNQEKQDDFVKSITEIEDEDSKLSGIQDEKTRDMKRKNTLGPKIDQVAKTMANTNPEAAAAFLDKMKGYMHGAQYQETLDGVRKRSLGVWSKVEGDRITKLGNTTKDMDLAELHTLAEETAKAIAEERGLDPVSELTLRNGIIENIDKNSNRMKKELAERNRTLVNDIGQTMNRPSPTGRNPITMSEATAMDPRFQDKVEEYEKTNPGFAKRLNDWFKSNSLQSPPWTPERQAVYAKFLGSTDEERMSYRPEQLFNDGKIIRDHMNHMMDMQANIERKSKIGQLIDPILTRNHSALNDAVAYPSKTDLRANERYKWLRGSAELRMQDHIAQKQAPMNIKEQDEMMKSLLEEVVTGKYDWYNPMRLFGEGPTDRRFTLEGQKPVEVDSAEAYEKVPRGSYYIYKGKLSGPKK